MRLVHLSTLGGRGDGDDQFVARLAGVAVDRDDRLYAVGDREVKRFSPAGSFESRFETSDAGWSLCVDGDSIWVGMHGAIVRYDDEGRALQRIEDPGRLGMITGLAVLGDSLVAADASNRTIHEYDGDGRWLREIGAEANTRGFMLPNGVLDLAGDAAGDSIVVAHPQKHRVERYDPQGAMVNKFGRFGMTDPGDFGGCCNPTNIAVAPEGQIAVSEKAPPLVKLFSADGELLAASDSKFFEANTKNIDLAVDSRRRLYAADPLRCTIEVFQIVRDDETVRADERKP